MKKILVFALALMLAVPALAFADGNDADITAQGTVVVTAALAVYQNCYSFAEGGIEPYTPQC